MPKKRLQPSPALMSSIGEAILTYGYSKLTMELVAKTCKLSRRALYFYFSGKSDLFRASVRFGNETALAKSFVAGRKRRSAGGNALEILSEIINVRYGDTRRAANASPHIIELNAEVFSRCNDIVREVAIYFEAELTKLIIEMQRDGLLHLRPDATAKELAQAIANGARGVNQRLPPFPPEELESRYREMCRFVLYGGADINEPSRSRAMQKQPG